MVDMSYYLNNLGRYTNIPTNNQNPNTIPINNSLYGEKIIPIKTNEYPYLAQRPLYSVLDIKETEKLLVMALIILYPHLVVTDNSPFDDLIYKNIIMIQRQIVLNLFILYL